jgi:uncharacterized protein (TIGR03067 family)
MTERDIFLAVLDLPDTAARAAYLESACGGDAARRARVDALLQAHENAGSFLASPVVALPEPNQTAAEATITPGGEADTEDQSLGFLAPTQRPDSLGRIGHYEVLEVLGRGGFGIVFRAHDEVLQRVVAVKVLSPEMAATSPARKRFLREARSSAQVRHENVVQVYAVEEQPLPYLVMELIPGETLQQRLDRTGPLDVPEALRIGRQVAEGLAAAHGQGLVHRDIKPANVMIEGGARQRVKLTDFGLARAADDASISQSGVVAGTPLYMAPEQAKGESLDHRADLFSLGSVLYAMLTGHPPFRAGTTLAVLKRVAEDTPRPIREVIPEVPQWFCRIAEKLHAKDPAERFQNAREVADLLADCETQWKAHSSLKDFSRIPGGRPVQRRSRGRRLALAAAIAIPLVAGLFVVANLLKPFWSRATIALPIMNPLPSPTAGWVDLFNGKNLNGWSEIGSKGTWIADGGVLRGIGRAGYLVSDRSYDTFHLKAEVRISPGTDFGILFHTDRVAADAAQPTTSGYGVQFTYAGLVNDVEGRVGVKMQLTGESPGGQSNFNIKPYEWLPIDVTVQRGGFRVNAPGGMVGADVRDLNKPGPIVLRLAKYNSIVELRNVRVEVTPASGAGDLPPLDSHSPATIAGVWESDWGPVTFEHGPVEANKPVAVTGSYVIEEEKKGAITNGTFDPAARSVRFFFAEPWWNGTGSVDLKLSADGSKLDGTWTNSNGESGLWTMIRRPVGKAPPSPAAQSGWVQLFNGKDLTGWKTHSDQPGDWKVQDGILIGRGPRSHLFSERGDYENFHLRVEAKINNLGNSGVYFRSEYGLGWGINPKGYEAQIFEGDAQDPYKTGSLYGLAKITEDLGKPNTWFTLDVITQGNRTVIQVDGKTTVDFVDRAATYMKGHFALQVERPPQTIVQFRKIEIKELPPAVAPPDTAKSDQEKIQGTWKGVSASTQGQQAPEWILKAVGPTVTFADNKVTWKANPIPEADNFFGGMLAKFSLDGIVHLDPTKSPKTIDLTVLGQNAKTPLGTPAPRVLLGIYKLEGDSLEICIAIDPEHAEERPTRFESVPGKAISHIKLRRQPGQSQLPPAVAPFDAAQAKEHQEAWARHLGVPIEYTNALGMRFRLIPPGQFTMGSSPAEVDWLLTNTEYKSAPPWVQDGARSESPDRRITVREPFYLGTYEVTVGQLREFTRATGYKTEAETNGGGSVWNTKADKWDRKPEYVWTNPEFSPSDSHPAVFITPRDARAFCKWLGEKDGRRYEVPTEEQWEWACRAGTTTRWFFGDEETRMKEFGWTSPQAEGLNHPVGRLAPNPFGLYDMYGNALELALTPQNKAVDRGGDAGMSAWRSRSASRYDVGHPDETNFRRGFRVAIVGDLAGKPPAARAAPAVVEKLRDVVAAKERALKMTEARVQAGHDNAMDLVLGQIELVDARIQLAEADGDRAAFLTYLQELVTRREEERRLVAVLVEAGRARPEELDRADGRVAEAKVRLAKEKSVQPSTVEPAGTPPGRSP